MGMKELGPEWFDKWLQGQEWGTTGVNDWAVFSAILPTAHWGAFPKHSAEDIQSGQGEIRNCCMYDHVQKSVLRSPFINPVHPKGPATLDDAAVGIRMAYFTAKPGFARLIPLLLTAICGRRGVAIGKGMLAVMVAFVAFLV